MGGKKKEWREEYNKWREKEEREAAPVGKLRCQEE